MDRLHQSVNDELKPSEVLKRLHELGLLDDDEVKGFKAMSLRERGAVMVEANDSAERPSDDVDIRHDPCANSFSWYIEQCNTSSWLH